MTMALPIGMRFRPTDLEIASYFLMNKALGHHMTAPTELEECHDIFSRHPRDLPDYGREKHWYLYCLKPKAQVTTNSYNLWTPTGEETQVLDPKKNGELVGIKRSFVFIENEDQESDNNCFSDEEEEAPKYNWFLDEISLPLTVLDSDWTVCHVFRKKIKSVNLPTLESEEEEEEEESGDDFGSC